MLKPYILSMCIVQRVLSSYFDLAEYFNPQERAQQRVYLTLGLKDSAPSTLLAIVGVWACSNIWTWQRKQANVCNIRWDLNA